MPAFKRSMEFDTALPGIAEVLRTHQSFFIAGHVKPDGDTIGCGLALASLLRRMGKKVTHCSKDPVPDFLRFLKGARAIKVADRVRARFDCAIILECVDFGRMGDIIAPGQAKTVVNIDHHAHFGDFGDINYVQPVASSCAEQVFYLFRHMKEPFTREEAESLYVGLVTDTGRFQQENATPEAFLAAAELVRAGVTPAKVFEKLYGTKPVTSLKLLGAALDTLRLTDDGRVAYMEITGDMYRATGAGVGETEGIINYALMAEGVVAAVLFRENEPPGTVKVSFRSRGSFDVNAICRHFGGGGHRNASGCSVEGSLGDAKKKVLEFVSRHTAAR